MKFSEFWQANCEYLLETYDTDGFEEAIFKAWLAGMEYGMKKYEILYSNTF